MKVIDTYACIYSGIVTSSRFSEDLFNEPATNTTINKGSIVVGVSANYYSSGTTAISTKTDTETSKNMTYVQASMTTSSALTSYGSIEYRNSTETLYAYLATSNY